MAEFLPAFQRTIRFEDPHMSGVVTQDNNGAFVRFGINEKANPDMPEGFWSCPAADALQMAEDRERERYWAPLNLDQILNQELADKIFDMSVNMGPKEAAVLAQRACTVGPYGQQLAIDGILGPASIQAINACPPDVMLQGLRDLSVAYYQHIEQVHPADVAWNGSWMARARA